MNKFYLLSFLLFATIHLQAQTGLQITSTCENDSLCLPTNECIAIDQLFSISATTDCSTIDIQYNFSIDWNDDGTIDSLGAGSNFTADFPIGIHRIKFTASDFCGDEENCEFVFEVMDCIAPVIVSDYVIDTFYMNSSGQMTFWAEEFYSSASFDNCTSFENLNFSISHDSDPFTTDTTLTITCNDLTYDCGVIINIAVWAEDESGNIDSIHIPLYVSAANGVCHSTWTVYPPGSAFGNLEMDSVSYLVNQTPFDSIFSYEPCAVVAGYSYIGDTIFPIYESDPLNGVTTYDIVLITKHILGLEIFNSPLQYIAADANSSGTITSLDLATIRSLILHISDEFPNGESWVFLPEYQIIEFPYSNYYFTGIKIGDVNESADPNGLQNNTIDTRTIDGTLNLLTKNQSFKKGETIAITMFAGNYKNLSGGQFTLDFDPTVLEFQNIEGNNKIDLGNKNFGLTYVDDGYILCSWNSSASQNLKPEEAFFNITFTSKKEGKLSDFFTINSQKLASEVYVDLENEIEFWNIELNLEAIPNNTSTNIFTISPNPFSEKTNFSFLLEKEGIVDLQIFDTNGRLVFSQNKNLDQGENQIEIQKGDLLSNGIYFYKIKTDNNVNSGKLILF